MSNIRSRFTDISAVTTSTAAAKSITIPSGVLAGDLLLLEYAGGAAPSANPTGWTLVQSGTLGGSGYVYSWRRVAQAGDAGSTVTLSFASSPAKTVMTLSGYYNTSTSAPLSASAISTGSTSTTSHPVATVTVPAGVASWVRTVIARKDDTTASTPTSYTPPSGTTLRVIASTAGTNQYILGVACTLYDVAGGTTVSGNWTSDVAGTNVDTITYVIAPLGTLTETGPTADITVPSGATIAGASTAWSALADSDPNTQLVVPLGSTALVGEEKIGSTLAGPVQQINLSYICDASVTTVSIVLSLKQGSTVIRTYSAITAVSSSEQQAQVTVSSADQAAQTNLGDIRVAYSITGS